MKYRKNADIYDNYYSHDWLERQHILKVRRVIRQIRRVESRENLARLEQQAVEKSAHHDPSEQETCSQNV